MKITTDQILKITEAFDSLISDLEAEVDSASAMVRSAGGTGGNKVYDAKLQAFQTALVHAKFHKPTVDEEVEG